VQETEISQWEVSDFFLKIDSHKNKTLKHGVGLCSYHMLIRKNFDPVGSKLL